MFDASWDHEPTRFMEELLRFRGANRAPTSRHNPSPFLGLIDELTDSR